MIGVRRGGENLVRVSAIALSMSVAFGCASVFAPPPRSAEYVARASCRPASGVPSAASGEESLNIARETLAKAFAAIANEHPEEHRQQIERTRVPVQRFPRLTFPAILDPEFVTAQEASLEYDPEEEVLGVSINGEHRAYPIKLLSRHEIVNDVVGGVPIAVTW